MNDPSLLHPRPSPKPLHTQPAAVGAPAAAAARGARRRVVSVAARKAAGAASQAYVCIDCGWIYDGKQGPFDKLPASYRCPVCNSGKKRFKKTDGGGKGGKAAATKGAAMRRSADDGVVDDSDKKQLGALAVGGALALAALYAVLSSQVS